MSSASKEPFEGYCWPAAGDPWHTPVLPLYGVEEAVRYINLQKILFHEVRIVDKDENVVLQAINGKIVFPVKEGI